MWIHFVCRCRAWEIGNEALFILQYFSHSCLHGLNGENPKVESWLSSLILNSLKELRWPKIWVWKKYHIINYQTSITKIVYTFLICHFWKTKLCIHITLEFNCIKWTIAIKKSKYVMPVSLFVVQGLFMVFQPQTKGLHYTHQSRERCYTLISHLPSTASPLFEVLRGADGLWVTSWDLLE